MVLVKAIGHHILTAESIRNLGERGWGVVETGFSWKLMLGLFLVRGRSLQGTLPSSHSTFPYHFKRIVRR